MATRQRPADDAGPHRPSGPGPEPPEVAAGPPGARAWSPAIVPAPSAADHPTGPDLAERLAGLIDRRGVPGRPTVVGITGVDTAGKSRFTATIADRLQANGTTVQPIHVDDFHRPRAERSRPGVPEPEQFHRYSIDVARLCREVLAPIRDRGRLDTRLRLLDHYTDTWSLDRRYRVEPGTVVLLEGIFLLRPELREHCDPLVFLHVDEATVLARAAERDIPLLGPGVLDRYRAKYLPGQREHLAAYPPERHADVIVDNRDPAAPRVLRWPED